MHGAAKTNWIYTRDDIRAAECLSGGCQGRLDARWMSINGAWVRLPVNYSVVYVYPNTAVTRNLSQFKHFDSQVYSALRKFATKQKLWGLVELLGPAWHFISCFV